MFYTSIILLSWLGVAGVKCVMEETLYYTYTYTHTHTYTYIYTYTHTHAAISQYTRLNQL